MQKSSSSPGLISSVERTGNFKTRRDPESWKDGWACHPTVSSAPRWTASKEGRQSSCNRRFTTHGHLSGFKERPPFASPKPGNVRFRDTWIQKHQRQWDWVPGPGSYRSEREFMDDKDYKDEVDTNLTIQEAAAEWSFSKGVKETASRLEEVKIRRNCNDYPKTTNQFTPGPGSYNQFTTFGTASGPTKHHYLGLRSVGEHGWKTAKESSKYTAKAGGSQIPPPLGATAK